MMWEKTYMDKNEKNYIRSCYLGLGASILALIFIFLCFGLIDYHLNPVYNLLVLLSLASPIVGLVFSLVGIIKTTQAEKKDIVAGSAGMTISILELLFIIIVCRLSFVFVFDYVYSIRRLVSICLGADGTPG